MEAMSSGLKVAVYIITLIFIYFGYVTIFANTVNMDIVKTILTYLQTILTLLIGYYWGSSSKQKILRDTQADDYAKAEAMELEEKRIAEANKEAERVEAERLRKAKEEAERVINEAQKKGEENVPIAKAV
jgi:amino acid permease